MVAAGTYVASVMRAGEFFETEYEGFGGGKPVANDIANDILNNFDTLSRIIKASGGKSGAGW